MNENQQELINFIYQNNLGAEDAARYVRDLNVPQEDKDAVMQDYAARQQREVAREEEKRKQEELARQQQLQVNIDEGLEDMRAARDKYEAASFELDNTGIFDFLGMETSFMTPGSAFMSALSPQKRFEAAKAAQAKAATDLQQNFYEAGREDLADMLQLPKSKFSRRAYGIVSTGSKAALYNTADFFSNNAAIEYQSQFYRDAKAGINMETEKTAGELVSDLGDAITNLDLEKIPDLFADIGEEAAMMLADQAPYLAATLIPYAGVPLNFMMRTAQAYQDVEDDVNLTETQKRTHSFLAGGIESIGDNIIGKTGNYLAGKAVSLIGSKLMSNAILRGATKVGGVTFGEGVSEGLQELAIMGSESVVLGRGEVFDIGGDGPLGVFSKEAGNRAYEGLVGGILVGGPLSGARSAVSRIAQPSPSQMASRPGDPSHSLAMEIGQKIDSIIEQAENVEPNSPEAKSLETELEALLNQEKSRVSKSRSYYSKMRRRDRKSYDRILELDDLIGRSMLKAKQLQLPWAEESSKAELEALLAERNEVYKSFEEKSFEPLSTLEQFEDAVEDIDILISEIDSDLDDVKNLQPENDEDLALINEMITHKGFLKNKKKSLQKALGEVQAAENSGNEEATIKALERLQQVIDQRPPRAEAKADQTNDDIEQDESEQVEQPADPEVVTPQQPERQPLTFSKDDNVSDDEIADLPTQLVKPIRNLLKGLKLPVTVKVHESVEALREAHPSKNQSSKAFYNPKTREVNVHMGSTVSDLRHEFIHAMMHNLLGDSKYRARLVNEVESIWGKDNVQKVREVYKDYSARNQDEEVITAFMERYATQDGLNQLRKRGALQKLKDLFNDLFNKSYGRYADEYLINTDSDLLAVMEAFVAGTEVGSTIQVQEQTDADAETSALDIKSRAYPDLEGKVVSFKVKYPNRFGEFTGMPQEKTVQVKDYWHWRNYWAKQTGNGKHDWIYDAHYRGDDGTVKKINNPNPKKDREGNVIEMEPNIFSKTQREVRSMLAYRKAVDTISSRRNLLLSSQAQDTREGRTEDSKKSEEIEKLTQAVRELNGLLDRRDPRASKYEAIRQRVMGDKPKKEVSKPLIDAQIPERGIPNSTKFLLSLKPNNSANFDDSVDSGVVLDSLDYERGPEINHPENIEVRDIQPEQLGNPASIVQYDKSDETTGVYASTQKNQVTSHASRNFAESMKSEIIATIDEHLRENPNKEGTLLTHTMFFSLQADSTLSNPRAIDEIVNQFNSLDESQRAIFLEAFDKKIQEVLSSRKKSRSGEINNPESIKAFLRAIEKVYGGVHPTDIARKHSPMEFTSNSFEPKKGQVVNFAFPLFDNNSDSVFIDVMNAMKGDDVSITANNSFISTFFTGNVARELGKGATQIARNLTAENFESVPTADVVAYTEVYFEIKKNPSTGNMELTSGLQVVEDPSSPFSWIIVSDKGSRLYGLPNSIPYRVVGKNVIFDKEGTSKFRGLTMGESYSIIDELEAGETKFIPVKIRKTSITNNPFVKVSDRKGRELSVSNAVAELARLEEAFNEADGFQEEQYLNDSINRIKDGLNQQEKDRRSLISSGKSSLARKQQGGVSMVSLEIDPTDRATLDPDETLDSREALDSVTNNTWAPRERSALQQKMDWMRLKFQDKFAPIMMMQEDIELAKGSRVEGDQNFKRSEELMYGKAHNDLEKLEAKVDRLKKAMNDGKVNPESLNDFLYARHAAERNAMLKDRDGVDNGSGLTDEEAANVLASFSPEEKAALEKAAAIADEISQDTRDTMRKFGLEADKRIDAFEGMFKHYVPLGGFAEDSKDVDNYPYPTGGIGFNVKGSTTKKAKGRKTPPANILAQIIQQNGAVKIKARRNEVLQSLFNLVKSNPNTSLWNTSDNIVVSDPDRAVGVRLDGEQKFIIFKDASLAKNLKGMGVTKLDALSKVMAKPANFLRAAFTTRNPEFIISNFSRDILSAIPNAIAEADLPDGSIKSKQEVARKIITRTPQTLKALLKGDVLNKDLDPVVAKYLSEFKEDGGQTGWGFVKPLETIAAELNNETNEGNKAKKAIKWMEKNSLAHIEAVNDAFENSIRLSSYIEAREAGASRPDAAQLAKNITVNFNKSGEYGAVANAYYLFFNASIQGSARIFRSLGKLKQVENPDGSISKQLSGPQRIVIGLGLASGMLAMINMALSDEDEDGELFYNKIPDYEKERNLIMMYDGKNYIKIPLPYGYNLFSNFGTALAETMAGERDADDALWFVANSAMSSFSPISFGQSENFAKYLAKGVAPTTLKPLVEIAVNETYFGSKVHQTQFPVGAKRPESELSFRSPGFIKSMFQWMNSATGGSEQVSGAVDVNPDLFWYPFEYYIGGLGQFGMRASKSVYNIEEMIRTGEKPVLEANDIPFLRKVYGEPSKYYDYDLYDNNKDEVRQLYKERKSADKKNVGRYDGIVKLDKKIKSVEKKLKFLRKERRSAQDLPYVQRVNKSAELQEKERILIMEYNELHEKLRGQ